MAVHKNEKTGEYYYDFKERKTRKHIYKTGFRLKSEAEEAEKEAKGKGDYIVQGKRFLYDVIRDKLNQIKSCKADSSYFSFSNLFRLHINGILVNKPIKNYTREEINKYYDLLAELGRSNNTINKVNSFLVNVFNYACKNTYIPYNPIAKMDKRKWEKKDTAYWTYEEYKKAIEYEDDYTYKMFWEFCMHNGIRKGERVIKWTDVNFETGVVTINKHIDDSGFKESRGTIKKGRKNNDGITITLDNYLIKELKKFKEYCKTFEGFSEDWYVFGNLKPLSRTNIATKLDKLCKKAGVTRITPHGLRHSCVSVAYQAGLQDQIIASRIGDTVEQVHKTYGHLKPNADKPVADLFDQLEKKSQKEDEEDG